jgi:GalNAc5-diNAcBac-PP-undecaprenol beta-1,3-glucosyltransferase
MKSTRVLVIIPTHDHPWSLDLSVESALVQTFENLDIVIIGDGVGDDTRDVVAGLLNRDDRIRFVDAPKSPSRSERVRHDVICSSDADVVAYLGDDDLFFPDHVESMAALLDRYDFAHPVSVCVDGNDVLTAFPADLSDPDCVEWHLQHGWNTIGLTGVAHSSEMYRRLPRGWTEPRTVGGPITTSGRRSSRCQASGSSAPTDRP